MLKNKEDAQIINSDHSFNIYGGGSVYLDGEFSKQKLTLISNVFGDDYDSEQTYSFSKEATKKLFETISFEDFIILCKEKRLLGLDEFLHENNNEYQTHTF